RRPGARAGTRPCRQIDYAPSVERLTAGAGTGRVRVVEREALLLDRVDEVNDRAYAVRRAHPVDDDLQTVEIPPGVPVERALVEEQLVAQTRAATRLNGDPQAHVVPALLFEQRLGLLGRRLGQRDTVGGRLVLGSGVRGGHGLSL